MLSSVMIWEEAIGSTPAFSFERGCPLAGKWSWSVLGNMGHLPGWNKMLKFSPGSF